MHLHSYQAKQLLRNYGISTLRFGVAKTLEELKLLMRSLDLRSVEMELTGKDREKVAAQTRDEAMFLAKKWVENEEKSALFSLVSIQEKMDASPKRQLSLSIDYEKALRKAVFTTPQHAYTWSYYPSSLEKEQIALPEEEKMFIPIVWQLLSFYEEKDGIDLQAEIVLKKGMPFVQDITLFIDERALFRNEELAVFYDPYRYTLQEKIAEQFDIDYTSFSGNIGCMVSGRGLGYALMDSIEAAGGKLSCCINVDKGASKDLLHTGWQVMLSDSSMEKALFYLITERIDCRVLAKDLVDMLKITKVDLPIFVRMEGNYVKDGNLLLEEAGIQTVSSFAEAVKKVTKKGGSSVD